MYFFQSSKKGISAFKTPKSFISSSEEILKGSMLEVLMKFELKIQMIQILLTIIHLILFGDISLYD